MLPSVQLPRKLCATISAVHCLAILQRELNSVHAANRADGTERGRQVLSTVSQWLVRTQEVSEGLRMIASR